MARNTEVDNTNQNTEQVSDSHVDQQVTSSVQHSNNSFITHEGIQ